jgi:RNA polymerase sigma factor (sigma-70 family)
MARLQTGEQSALELIYGKYSSLLYSVAVRVLGDPATAEEILQDTFFQLWQSAGKFDSAKGSLAGWLLVITRNRALSRLRRRSADCHCKENEDDLLVDLRPTALDQEIARQLVCSALTGLTEAQQEAITLAYFEGLTSTEIASRTKAPVGTVKARLRTALQSMKKRLVQPPKARVTGVTLADILITDEIFLRPRRARTLNENESLRILDQAALTSPQHLIDTFLQLAIDLCHAGTAGLSFLESSPDGTEIFRWTNLAGKLCAAVGGTTPRDFSPCGVTLDRRSPQLFAHPARYFHYFKNVKFPIVEGLVIPFDACRNIRGTVWIVSHNDRVKFDSADVSTMSTLTNYVASVLQFGKSLRPSEMPPNLGSA